MDTLCSRGRTNVGGVDILRMKFPFQMRARDLFSSSFTPPPKRRSRACNLHDYTLGSRIGSLDKWTSTNISFSLSLSIEQFLSVQITIVIIMIPDFLSRALPRSIAQGVLLYKSEFHFLIPLRLYYIQVAAISIVDSYMYRALLKR